MEKEELTPNQGENHEPRVLVVEKLERNDGEVDFSKLSEGDKFQLLTRYLNDMCSINKSILQITADAYVLLELVCKAMGIDVKAEKAALVKKYKAMMDENIKKSKEALESLNPQRN